MSNVSIVRRSYDAFSRGDMDAVVADMHDQIEWQQAQGLPHGGTYHGLDEVRRNVFDPLDRDWWSEFSAEPDELLDAGDEVVVLGRYRGVAKRTSRRLDVPFVHVWSLRDGQGMALSPVPRHPRLGRGARAGLLTDHHLLTCQECGCDTSPTRAGKQETVARATS